MPTYDFSCINSTPHKFELFLTFSEFDGCKGVVKCPTCGAPTKILIPESPPHSSVVHNDSFGKAAELNSKKLGKYGVEDKQLADAKKRKPKKETKKAWYGSLGSQKTKEIICEKDPVKKKERIHKYVHTGE